MTRQASRTDANQNRIVGSLRMAGADVLHLHTVGKGCPDILVGANIDGERRNILMEIKTDKGYLTDNQVEWLATWRGQVAVVRSVEDALKLIGRA